MNHPVIQQEMAGDEILHWAAEPGGGLRLRKSDVLLIPFSLLWGGFAIFWEYKVLLAHAPLFFKLWGVPFVLVGLYMMVGRFFLDALRRGRTVYGLSDRRVLIVTDLHGRSVRSVELAHIPELHLEVHGDLSGTITLGPTSTGKHQPRSPAFEFIEEPRMVYGLVRTLCTRTR